MPVSLTADSSTRLWLLSLRAAFLEELEELLGARDQSHSLGEIGFINGVPHIFRNDATNCIDIMLGHNAIVRKQTNKNDHGNLAKWQLAHECLHLLDPYFPPPTNVLEEGLACWFQNRKVDGNGFGSNPSYARAERLVALFMEGNYLPGKLRILRQGGVRIGDVTSEQLQREACRIPPNVADMLTEKFADS